MKKININSAVKNVNGLLANWFAIKAKTLIQIPFAYGNKRQCENINPYKC